MSRRYAIGYVSTVTLMITVQPHVAEKSEVEKHYAPDGHVIFEEIAPQRFFAVARRLSGQWVWEKR